MLYHASSAGEPGGHVVTAETYYWVLVPDFHDTPC